MSISSTKINTSTAQDAHHATIRARPNLKLDTSTTGLNSPLGFANEEGLYDTVEWGRRPTIEYHMRVMAKRDRQYNSMFERIKQLANEKQSLQEDLRIVDNHCLESWKKERILTNEAREKDKENNELRYELKSVRREMTALFEEYMILAENYKKVMKDHSGLRAGVTELAAEYAATKSNDATMVDSSDNNGELDQVADFCALTI